MAPMTQAVTCRHCAGPIEPCPCSSVDETHWQDAGTPVGLGTLHCPGEPHQRHEPGDGNG